MFVNLPINRYAALEEIRTMLGFTEFECGIIC